MFYIKNKSVSTPPHKIVDCHSEARQNRKNPAYKKSAGLPRFARNDGFTLAEVLITLVIIGVIAAITVPTLIVKYQKEQTVTRLKKAYSALAQTTNRAISDYGPLQNWEIGENGSGEAAHDFFKKYMAPYLNIMKDCSTNTEDECKFNFRNVNTKNTTNSFGNEWSRFYLNDGTLIALQIANSTNVKRVFLYLDINGQQKPNLKGRDIFRYNYTIKENSQTEGKITPDGVGISRDLILEECRDSVGMRCAALIMKDGWRISDDYPW